MLSLRLFFKNIFQVDLFGFQKLLHLAYSLVNGPLILSVLFREEPKSNHIFLNRKLYIFEFLVILDWILCLPQNLQS